MTAVNGYPTGDPLIDELVKFCGKRLPALLGPVPRAVDDKPSLAEDWWVADKLDSPLTFPFGKTREDGFRACYRWARQRNPFHTEGAADLLLHQMSELLPILFRQARTVIEDQRLERMMIDAELRENR